jgi:AbiJ N-terminal domain 4
VSSQDVGSGSRELHDRKQIRLVSTASGSCKRYNQAMAIFDLYSRRKRQIEKAGRADVYQYDEVPRALRVQIIHMWRDAIGPCSAPNLPGFGPTPPNSDDLWEEIHSAIAREKGVFALAPGNTAFDRCAAYLLGADRIDDILDLLELTFRYIRHFSALDKYDWHAEAERRGLKQPREDTIGELNFRLREAGLGYQLENWNIIRVDSQFLHSEVVKKALHLLSHPGFEGPEREFLAAHDDYRNGPDKFENAITNALKAFESTLKVICDREEWAYSANATAAALIKAVIENGLLPPYLESSFGALQSLMIGLPTIRNKTAGHGRGASTRDVQPDLVAYALHSAAANIVFLVEAHRRQEIERR